MRELIDIIEDADLKKQIIQTVKNTDSVPVLNRVLGILQSGDIDERIKSVIGHDSDAKPFIKQIMQAILEIDAPMSEKNAFLDKYKSGGVVNTSRLLDGKLHSFADIVGPGFTEALFTRLAVELVSLGVGPGEVALAVLSPEIQWSGRTSGGGDIQVKKKPVEVKGRVSKGGRWINARKAKLDLGKITKTIADNLMQPVELPDRISPLFWIDNLRPAINPKKLASVCQEIADATFKFADNSSYKTALQSGSATAIINTFLDVGYKNYKNYSKFDGMLLLDVPTQQMQYFADYADMKGSISVGTVYISAPEGEMMPQVVLSPEHGDIRAGYTAAEKERIAQAKAAEPKIPKLPNVQNATNLKQLKTAMSAYVENIAVQRGLFDLTRSLRERIVDAILKRHSLGISNTQLKKELIVTLDDVASGKLTDQPEKSKTAKKPIEPTPAIKNPKAPKTATRAKQSTVTEPTRKKRK